MRKKKDVQVSDYLVRTKHWKVRNMVAKYLTASETFRTTYARSKSVIDFPYRSLDQICDALYDLKEEHHLIFKRVVGPERIRKEDRHKFEPDQAEVDFIANIGRLFHKTLVARELKYIFNHYDPLENGSSEARLELEEQLNQILQLFDEGTGILISFMQRHSSNVLLLSLLLENAGTLKKSIGMQVPEVLKQVTGQSNPEATYYLTGKYYLEGGWFERAEQMFKKILAKNPKHNAARQALEEARMQKAKKTTPA